MTAWAFACTRLVYEGSHLIQNVGIQGTSSERLSNLLQVTQLACNRDRIQITRLLASKLYQIGHTLQRNSCYSG